MPVFTSFVLKKINSVNLDKSSADIYGTMKVNIQLDDYLVKLIKDRKKTLKILITLPRECSI